MTWSDSLLWNIRPDCKNVATEIAQRLGMPEQLKQLQHDQMQQQLVHSYDAFDRTADRYNRLPVEMHSRNIAIVSVDGPCVNRDSNWAASYPRLTKAFQMLQDDNAVRAVVVVFNTPGGTVAGLDSCAKALNLLAETKLTIGQNDGGCYSAGYFLASQCGEIVSGSTDHIGNIGSVISLNDFSEYYKDVGIRSVTKKTGPIKGLGIFGDPITTVQEEFLQHLVDEHFAEFRTAVMTGRKMTEEQFAAVSQGHWWLGREAVENGIVDRISTLPETLQAIEANLAA